MRLDRSWVTRSSGLGVKSWNTRSIHPYCLLPGLKMTDILQLILHTGRLSMLQNELTSSAKQLPMLMSSPVLQTISRNCLHHPLTTSKPQPSPLPSKRAKTS